jgi:patatin-like phospholipase/acyl hydrolase
MATFRILSLDGGGMRGSIVPQLWRRLKTPSMEKLLSTSI